MLATVSCQHSNKLTIRGVKFSLRPATSSPVLTRIARNTASQSARFGGPQIGRQGFVSSPLRRLRGETLVLREAASTDEIKPSESDGKTYMNGNGNGYATNGNGKNGYANGNSANGVKVNLVATSGTNGTAVNGSVNGTKSLAAALSDTEKKDIGKDVEDFLEPCDAGQLEACAAERITERELAEKGVLPKSAQGTPYMSPGGKWSKFKKYSTFQRTFEIWKFAIQFFWKLWLVGKKWTYGKAGMTEQQVSARKQELAVWLREGLVKLGPTFIKIGQQFSTRVDVLSPEFVKELEKLQDNVPPFDSDAAISTIESELGKKMDDLFEEFDPQPIAAASLGQVHLAKINGQRVVVKVQRPGLKELFDIDLKNIRVIAQWLQNVDPKSDGAARDWVAIYDECSRILYQEIDYTLEGKNADRFRTNFADKDWIKVPEVLWGYVSPKVLTMEYAPGIKINRVDEIDALGIDRKRLARLSVESYLQQLLTHGFFHADPHPGNIAVDAAGGGRLIYYDFGMMGTIPSGVRAGLLELFYGVYEKDPDRCLDALVEMGVLVPITDRTAVRRTAEFFLSSFQERLKAQRQEAQVNPEYGSSFKPQASKEDKSNRRKQILSAIGEDLLQASADKPFRFPATFTFVVRSFTVLDGIGKGLDPRFDISEIAAPYARDLLLEARPQFTKLFTDVKKRAATQNRAVVNLFKGPNMIEDVATTMAKLERGDLKLRVRALETERALNRVMLMQRVTTSALAASTLVNMGTVLTVSAMSTAATLSFTAAGACGLIMMLNWIKVKSLEKKELQLMGAA